MLWYTSFASSILWKFHISKSRSSITLHDEHFSDNDHWLYFKSHFTSHIRYMHIDISIEIIIFIVVHFSIMCAHAPNIFTIQKSKTFYNYYTICVWKLNMNTSFTFRLSTWSIVRIFFKVSSSNAWSSARITLSRTSFLMSTLSGSGDTWSVLEFHLISFEQEWGSFHVMSHVVRMIDLSSHGVSSFFMMNTWMISMIVLDIINDIKSSMIAIRHFLSWWSYLSSSTHLLQIVLYHDHIHWPSSFDTKSKMSKDNVRHRYNHEDCKKSGSGKKNNWSVYFCRVVFYRLDPRHVFCVPWILSADSIWVPRLPTIFLTI